MSERLPTTEEARLLAHIQETGELLKDQPNAISFSARAEQWIIRGDDGDWLLTVAGRAALDAYRRKAQPAHAPADDVTRYDPDLAALAAASEKLRRCFQTQLDANDDGKQLVLDFECKEDGYTAHYLLLHIADLRRLIEAIDRVIAKGELK